MWTRIGKYSSGCWACWRIAGYCKGSGSRLMRRRWRRTERCARLCGGTRVRVTRSFCAGWRRPQGSQPRRAKTWRGWIASARSGRRNKEWKSPADEDARIAKMKDGRTHLAHKAEHAVDLDTGAVVAVTLQSADQGDTTTLDETLCEAGMAVAEQVGRETGLRPHRPTKVNRGG